MSAIENKKYDIYAVTAGHHTFQFRFLAQRTNFFIEPFTFEKNITQTVLLPEINTVKEILYYQNNIFNFQNANPN